MDQLIALDSRHRGAITAHLLALSAEDRADRFTGTVSDEVVQDYVGAIGYARDVLVGALQERRLVGLAHAAVYLERGELVCEVGISVDAAARRCGLGHRLLRAAMAGAQRFRVRRVIVLFRHSNRAMAALTRKIGGRVEREGAESSAIFEINPDAELPEGMRLHSTRSFQGGEVLQALHAHERGRVLLIHGAGGDAFQWLPQLLPALWAAGWSVCAPTLPGHGRGSCSAGLDEMQACVTQSAAAFSPTLLIGHSMGGYLVQRHLQHQPAAQAVLLASVPPRVPRLDDLRHLVSELHCLHSQAVALRVLRHAPDLDTRAIARTPMRVLGGVRDRVVPMPWVRDTARRYGVAPRFVDGGHRLMLGRAAGEVMREVAA